jgi:hypothetical protein
MPNGAAKSVQHAQENQEILLEYACHTALFDLE